MERSPLAVFFVLSGSPAAPSRGAGWGVETPDSFQLSICLPKWAFPGPLSAVPSVARIFREFSSVLRSIRVTCSKDFCLSSDSLSLQHVAGGWAVCLRTDPCCNRSRSDEVTCGPKVWGRSLERSDAGGVSRWGEPLVLRDALAQTGRNWSEAVSRFSFFQDSQPRRRAARAGE